MNLPARQQRILDQIEQVLQATDPRLESAFAAFTRRASGALRRNAAHPEQRKEA